MASEATKAKIIDAALETLRTAGIAGASARAIGRAGGFNQALIFYHFGSVRELLIAALDRTSAERMAAYRAAAEEAGDLVALTGVAGRIYREDLASGHVKVMVELIAGASSDPALAPEIVERMQPWIRFAREEVERIGAGSPLAALVPPEDAAYAIVAIFLGLEMLSHLEGDTARTERLFELANALASMVTDLGLIGPPPAGDPA
jgi:AcrR family transcriptional regulator